MQGWIKLYRQFRDWEWYDNINVKVLFLHLLLTVNHEDNKWRGRLIKKGERVTSLQKLAKEIKLSVQQTRTALNKLEMTGEITRKPTNEYTHIIIVNWEEYQSDNKSSTRKPTNDQQTDNKRITNDQQLLKNEKNEKNEKNIVETSSTEETEQFSFEEKLEKLKLSDDKRFPIIALYLESKGIKYENKDQHLAGVKRNLRPAKDLIGYSKEQIKKTMEHLNSTADFKWTLETVNKYIDDLNFNKNSNQEKYEEAIKRLNKH